MHTLLKLIETYNLRFPFCTELTTYISQLRRHNTHSPFSLETIYYTPHYHHVEQIQFDIYFNFTKTSLLSPSIALPPKLHLVKAALDIIN